MSSGTTGRQIVAVHEATFTTCMEQLQEGWVYGVAATAGCLVEPISRDKYGLDLRIVKPRGSQEEELMIAAQLKNTTLVRPDTSNTTFSYKFKKRSHLEHLTKARSTQKAILLVMVTSRVQAEWTAANHDCMTVQHCCYWANLEGVLIADGVQSPSVKISTANIFDATALLGIFDRLAGGQLL